ncbi:MAG: chromosome segregation protein SMC [Deltaproteobacteria bacterium]|nr:chromosome segregation protein SMC [Deltaproteobacteria bacterium]
MRLHHACSLLLVASACTTGAEYTRVVPASEAAPDAGPVAAAPVDAGPPAPKIDVDALRAEAKSLLQKQAELSWKSWTAGEPLDLASTYAGHDALFSADSVAAVQAKAQAESDPAAKRALGNLELYLTSEHLAKETAALDDQLAALEGSATVTVDGVELPYRNVESMLANEPDHAKRLALQNATSPVVKRLAAVLEKRDARLDELIQALGYPSYAALSARLRDCDLDALAKQADAVLTQTDAPYKKAMADAVHKELVLPLTDMHRADVPRFFHSSAVQSAFPGPQMVTRFNAFLAGMGVDLVALKLTVDSRDMPRKNPRALCIPVSVPGDVRLSFKPKGGVDDYAQLYHEGGHAVQFAATTTPVWEFQQLGDSAVAQAFAFLFEDRLEDPRYLAELGMTGELLHGWVRSAAVKKLYLLRRAAAKVLVAQARHGAQPLAGAALVAKDRELMGRAEGFALTDADAERDLVEPDDFFAAADELRAWILAAQLDAALSKKFGESWWRSPQAGQMLRGLWAHGSELTAEQMAQAVGAKDLDAAPLLNRLQRALQ